MRAFGFNGFGWLGGTGGVRVVVTPPVGAFEFTSDTTPSSFEGAQSIPITYNKPATLVYLTGEDMGLWEIIGTRPGTSFTLRGLDNRNIDLDDDFDENATHILTINAVSEDSEVLATDIVVTIQAYDTIPDAFTTQTQNNAALSTVYTSADFTVSGMETGYAPSATLGTGTSAQINGSGSYLTDLTGVTFPNGTTFKLRRTSSGSYDTGTPATLTINGVTATFAITTLADPAAVGFVFGGAEAVSQAGGTQTFSNKAFGTGVAVVFSTSGGTATGITLSPVGGGTDIVLTKPSQPPGDGGTVVYVGAVTAGNYDIKVSHAFAFGATVAWGTASGAKSTATSATAMSTGSISDPHDTASLTVPSGGMFVGGIAFVNGATATANSPSVLRGQGGGMIVNDDNRKIAIATATATGVVSFNIGFGSSVTLGVVLEPL